MISKFMHSFAFPPVNGGVNNIPLMNPGPVLPNNLPYPNDPNNLYAHNSFTGLNNNINIDTVKLLPIEEMSQYKVLIDTISSDVLRARRHSGLSEFIKHITLVHKFVRQGNSNDSLRGIVCGVEFGRGFILVNTDRLKKILYRSKSCMNGCFQRLGYDVMRPSHDLACLFTRLLPSVNPEFFAIRQWCVRLVTDQCTLCFLSNMPDAIASNFEVHRIPTQRQMYQQQQQQLQQQQQQYSSPPSQSPPPLLQRNVQQQIQPQMQNSDIVPQTRLTPDILPLSIDALLISSNHSYSIPRNLDTKKSIESIPSNYSLADNKIQDKDSTDSDPYIATNACEKKSTCCFFFDVQSLLNH